MADPPIFGRFIVGSDSSAKSPHPILILRDNKAVSRECFHAPFGYRADAWAYSFPPLAFRKCAADNDIYNQLSPFIGTPNYLNQKRLREFSENIGISPALMSNHNNLSPLFNFPNFNNRDSNGINNLNSPFVKNGDLNKDNFQVNLEKKENNLFNFDNYIESNNDK